MAGIRLNILGNIDPLRRELRRGRRVLRQFQQDVNQAGGGFAGLRAGTSGLIAGFGGLATVGFAAAGAVGAVGFAAVRAASQYDDARKSIVRATGAVGEELGELITATDNVFREVSIPFAEVAGVVGTVATAFSDELNPAVEEATKSMVELAKFAGVPTQEVADLGVRIARQFGIASDEVDRFNDVLATTAQETNANPQQILNTLLRAGPQLQALGLDAFQATDVVGQLVKGGLPERRISSILDSFIGRVTVQGRDPGEAFRELLDRIRDAETGLEKLSIASEYVTATYGPGIVTIADGIGLTLRTSAEVAEGTEGALARVDEATDSWSDNITELGNVMKSFAGGALRFLGRELNKHVGDWLSFGSVVAETGNLVQDVLNDIVQSGVLGREEVVNPRTGEVEYTGDRRGYFADFATLTADEQLVAGARRYVADPVIPEDEQLTRIVQALEAGEITRRQAINALAGIQEVGGAVGVEAARVVAPLRQEELLDQNQETVQVLRARVRAGLGGEQELIDALGRRRDLLPAGTERYDVVGEIAGLLVSTTRDTTQEVARLGSAAGSAANELFRLVDGVIELNDAGLPAFTPAEVVSQTVSGNTTVTAIRRAQAASNETNTTGGRRSDSNPPVSEGAFY